MLQKIIAAKHLVSSIVKLLLLRIYYILFYKFIIIIELFLLWVIGKGCISLKNYIMQKNMVINLKFYGDILLIKIIFLKIILMIYIILDLIIQKVTQ